MAQCSGYTVRRDVRYPNTDVSLYGQGTSRFAPYRPSLAVAKPSTQAAPTTTAGDTWRDVCLQIISEKFPRFEPRNDFDIFTLGTSTYNGDQAELGTWLDSKLAKCIGRMGSLERVMDKMRSSLILPSSTITGVCAPSCRDVYVQLKVASQLKPKPRGIERNVFLRPIPHTAYSIRLFPGSLDAQEYCMDFVDTRTGTPVNSPFQFELWAVPDPAKPWLGCGSLRIHNLESAFGYSDDQILPGHEKFVLRDGQTCLLKRPGKKDIRFTVPIRSTPVAGAVGGRDVHELDLPAVVVA